jgi:6,7-dimethyl-8-ribityllumazine synthase
MAGTAEKHWEGLTGKGKRFAIVASRFNGEVVEKLVNGAKRAFREYGVADEDIKVYWCPGALEIAPLARRVARHWCTSSSAPLDGIVCCGAVIQGETDHYRFVAAESMAGVAGLANEANIAVGNAILTVATLAQALARCREDNSNKGYEAAVAVLVMAAQYEQLP